MHGSTNLLSVFTTIFGEASSNEGMGLFNSGLDWQYVQSTYLSLQSTQQVNSWISYVIWYAVMLGLFYNNVWDAKNFLFLSNSLFLSKGTQLSTAPILTSEGTIHFNGLDTVGLPSMTQHGAGLFTANPAIRELITHVFIFYRKDKIPEQNST